MTDCTRCHAKTDTYACTKCTDRLRKMLAELPNWLTELEYTAAGQSKTGDQIRRAPRYRRPLDGDSYPIAPFPDDNEPNLAKARHDREQAVLRDALARGKVHTRAADLLDKAEAILLEWVRDLCETNKLTPPTPPTPRTPVADPNEPQPPWIDATTIHVADGNPGRLCTNCFTYHRGECA